MPGMTPMQMQKAGISYIAFILIIFPIGRCGKSWTGRLTGKSSVSDIITKTLHLSDWKKRVNTMDFAKRKPGRFQKRRRFGSVTGISGF